MGQCLAIGECSPVLEQGISREASQQKVEGRQSLNQCAIIPLHHTGSQGSGTLFPGSPALWRAVRSMETTWAGHRGATNDEGHVASQRQWQPAHNQSPVTGPTPPAFPQAKEKNIQAAQPSQFVPKTGFSYPNPLAFTGSFRCKEPAAPRDIVPGKPSSDAPSTSECTHGTRTYPPPE
jgi:hypothetical protein